MQEKIPNRFPSKSAIYPRHTYLDNAAGVKAVVSPKEERRSKELAMDDSFIVVGGERSYFYYCLFGIGGWRIVSSSETSRFKRCEKSVEK